MCECTGQSLSAHTHTWARGETRFKCAHSLCARAAYIQARASGLCARAKEIRVRAGRFALAHYINLLSRYKNALSTFGSKITPYNTSRWHGSPNHQWLWKLQTGLQATSLQVFLQTLRPWFPNEMQNLLSSEKRTLDRWATVQFFFSTAQVRCFWRCLWFRSGLVALFLKTSERGDSRCTDSSFSPLLVKLSQVFESALLDCILKLAVIPVACAPFPTQIRPSIQLCI